MTTFDTTTPSGKPTSPHDAISPLWKVLGATGLVIALVGAIQIAEGWFPMRFGNHYWRYQVAGGTVDSLSLITAGVIALTASFIARSSARGLRLLSVANATLCVLAVSIFVVFVTSLGRVQTMAQNANDLPSFRAAVILTTVTALASMFVYGCAAWIGWREASE